MLIEAVFKAVFSFADVLFTAKVALNHINDIERGARNIRFNEVGFSSSMKSVLVTTVFNVRTCSTVGNITSEGARFSLF